LSGPFAIDDFDIYSDIDSLILVRGGTVVEAVGGRSTCGACRRNTLGAISGANGGPNVLAMAVIALLVSGSGCAMINAQITAAAVSAVPSDRAATASAICVTMRQIGFSFGIALLGAALQLSSSGDYLAAFAVAGASTLALTAIVYWLMGGKQTA
jgi:hypothetical protein